MRLSEIALLELKTLDTTKYGGWIPPDNKVHYVKPYRHEDFALLYLNELGKSSFEPSRDLFKMGWVRFHTEDLDSMGVFSVDGSKEGLKATYKVWASTAMKAEDVYLDDKQYRFPRDKAKFIKMFTNG